MLIDFLLGLVLLIAGAELLVRGASTLARSAGISPLVIGLTVVAYGTSAPEVAVGVRANLSDPPEPDLALGNIVGSNISNIFIVLGLSSIVMPLIVQRQLLRTALPLMCVSAMLVMIFGWDGTVEVWEGVLLLLGAVVYSAWEVIQSRRLIREERRERQLEAGNAEATAEVPRSVWAVVLSLLALAVGLAGLLLGADWLVRSAREVAQRLQVSELVIGLTLVAVGTSLPEIATSVTATIRGKRDLAIGNVVGSNIFNVLLVLGICAVTAPQGLPVPLHAIRFDIPVMIAATLLCIPMFVTGLVIARWEGLVLLSYYGTYAGFLFVKTADRGIEAGFHFVLQWLILPLTAFALLLVCLHAWRRGH